MVEEIAVDFLFLTCKLVIQRFIFSSFHFFLFIFKAFIFVLLFQSVHLCWILSTGVSCPPLTALTLSVIVCHMSSFILLVIDIDNGPNSTCLFANMPSSRTSFSLSVNRPCLLEGFVFLVFNESSKFATEAEKLVFHFIVTCRKYTCIRLALRPELLR